MPPCSHRVPSRPCRGPAAQRRAVPPPSGGRSRPLAAMATIGGCVHSPHGKAFCKAARRSRQGLSGEEEPGFATSPVWLSRCAAADGGEGFGPRGTHKMTAGDLGFAERRSPRRGRSRPQGDALFRQARPSTFTSRKTSRAVTQAFHRTAGLWLSECQPRPRRPRRGSPPLASGQAERYAGVETGGEPRRACFLFSQRAPGPDAVRREKRASPTGRKPARGSRVSTAPSVAQLRPAGQRKIELASGASFVYNVKLVTIGASDVGNGLRRSRRSAPR